MYDYLEPFLLHVLQDNLNVNYVQVSKNGKVIEEYCRVPVKTRLNTWSMCKGIVSCAVGIAKEEGLISLDEKLVDCYPMYEAKDPRLQEVTLEHMLTMTTGLKESLFFCDGADRYTTRDWAAYFFENARIENDPGTKFLYSNHNTYLLSRLIEERCGVNLLEYLRNRLLEPMGMHNPDWTLCPLGHVHAANGLYFTIDEVTAYANLLLNKGEADGKQLVPRAYLEEAFRPKVTLAQSTPEKPLDGIENAYYGYQFWLNEDLTRINQDGNYGQYCHVFPKQNMTVAIMAFEGAEKNNILRRYVYEDLDKRILSE